MTEFLVRGLHLPDDTIAVSFGDVSLSYRSLFSAVQLHCSLLQQLGVKPNDTVAVYTQPSLGTIIALVGNLMYGATSVPLDPKLGPKERDHILNDSAPVASLAASPHELGLPNVQRILSPEHDQLDKSIQPLFEGNSVNDTCALVLYTSGTTGLPKGVPVTRRAIAFCLDGLAKAWDWTKEVVLVHALPLFHVHGLVLGIFGPLRVGATVHWLGKFEEERIAQALSSKSPQRTMLFGVPTMYHRLADAAERSEHVAQALSSVNLLVSGSAPLSVRESARIEKLTRQRVVERYGMTETLITCATRKHGPVVTGRVGQPLEGLDLQLVDDQGSRITTHDDQSIGEIVIKGPSVFSGYLHRPDATRDVFDEDGYFHTGDLATIDQHGSVRIVGRKATDLIKCGGYRIGAGEIEATLCEHPHVNETAVVGIADDDLGEKIVVFVVLKPGISPSTELGQTLSNHVAQYLSPHKRPREVVFVHELPRNAMGKVQKSLLKAQRKG